MGCLHPLPPRWGVAIDNNVVERAIKPVVIGRKNFLFAGSDASGETLVSAMTSLETAKINGLDPQAYLAEILARVQDHKINRIDDPLPWNRKPAPNQAAAKKNGARVELVVLENMAHAFLLRQYGDPATMRASLKRIVDFLGEP